MDYGCVMAVRAMAECPLVALQDTPTGDHDSFRLRYDVAQFFLNLFVWLENENKSFGIDNTEKFCIAEL